MENNLDKLSIHFAEEKDVSIIFTLIKELADYEKMLDLLTVDEDLLRKHLFGDNKFAEVLIAEYNTVPIGYAIFFHNFSTFTGKPGLYLEDLYVKPEYRGNCVGKAMLSHLAKIAVERDCGRFEWVVLDWNEPSIKFYKSLGAKPLNEWVTYRLEGDPLKSIAKKF